jgi:hypothetical protein
LPTDYISSADVEPPQHPRKGLRAIAQQWFRLIEAWREGRELEDHWIAGPHSPEELAPLLEARAGMLMEWSEDDSLWEDE